MESASYTYLDTPNPNLVCCICRCPFNEPCTTRTCSHTFCYECISQAIAINCQCPIDRTPLSLHDLAPADPVVRNLVDELLVQCPHRHLGCSHTCQRLLLPVHLADTCQYVQVHCPDLRCTRSIMRKDAEEHRCGEPSLEQVAEETQKQVDEDAGTTENGSSGPRQPSGSASAASADLAAENAMLRLRLSSLENVVHALRSEMYAVKHALGPWYRPELQPQFHTLHHPQPPLATTSQAAERSLSELEHEDGSDHLPESSPHMSLEDPSDIASYFPTQEEATRHVPNGTSHPHPRRTRAATDASYLPPTGRVQAPTSTSSYSAFPSSSAIGFVPGTTYAAGPYANPSSAAGLSHPPGGGAAATSPTVLSIPPLDPTTPLPDTLVSLHSSLGTLAGALGALAAARGSESLRTTEEIRGMRAAMHGLRMQMHDVLTSRSHIPGQGATGPMGGSADLDASDGAPLGTGVAHWPGYAPRPYGQFPLYPLHAYPTPHPGMTHPPPTNITKL